MPKTIYCKSYEWLQGVMNHRGSENLKFYETKNFKKSEAYKVKFGK